MPDADAKPLELVCVNPEDWIATKALAALLASQGIEGASMRTLQNWGDKHQATKPGFEPRYLAKKDKGKLVWKPA